jgi:hypothetical protein
MGAIEKHYGLAEAAVLALQAGVDLLLIADDRLADDQSASVVALGGIRRALLERRIDPDRVAEALRRVGALADRAGTGSP